VDTARIICAFLSDRAARAMAFGDAFETPFPAIFKTGTANQYQSIAALGATPRYTVGVWMGNLTGETVIGKTGSSVPATIVRDTLISLQGGSGPPFPLPENYSLRKVCALSGLEPGAACPSVLSEYVAIGGTLPPCSWHRLEGGRVVTSYPAEAERWFESARRLGDIDHTSSPLTLLTPRNGFIFYADAATNLASIPLEAAGGLFDTLTIQIDNRTVSLRRPFISTIDVPRGEHLLFASNGDESASVRFRVE
jgi:penicillin-binding protein 1C